MKTLTHWLNKQWYQDKKPVGFLRLLTPFYRAISQHIRYFRKKRCPHHFPIPVIVVGNLSVGGTGKTPAVISLYEHLIQMGLNVAIVTRGYKNSLSHFPHQLSADDSATRVGDEAYLMFQKTKAPIWIATKRMQALEAILQRGDIDVILSDDGLQHDAMPRHIECVVIDGARGFGNNYCLPAGPLREDIERLASVDFIFINGQASKKLETTLKPYQDKCFQMDLITHSIYALNEKDAEFNARCGQLAAFAGIGHPERFFANLRAHDIIFTPYAFNDHHIFAKKDFDIPESCIIMTEKDAVKCKGLSDKAIYVLPVEATFPITFWQQLQTKLSTVL